MKISDVLMFPTMIIMFHYMNVNAQSLRRIRNVRRTVTTSSKSPTEVNTFTASTKSPVRMGIRAQTQSTKSPFISTKAPLFCPVPRNSKPKSSKSSKGPKSKKSAKLPKSTKKFKSSKKSKNNTIPTGLKYTHIYEVELIVSSVCGEDIPNELSSMQKSNVVAPILTYAQNNIADLDISSVNIMTYVPATCCNSQNPQQACDEVILSETKSILSLAIPVHCGSAESCPEQIIPTIIEGMPSTLLIGDAYVASNVVITEDNDVNITQRIVNVATECVMGNDKCSVEATCCGVVNGCVCNDHITESYCDEFGCTIDPGKGCCAYDICNGF